MEDTLTGLVQSYSQSKISRRDFLRGATALGLSMSAASTLLSACAPAATEAPKAAATAVPTAVPPTATPKPKEPVTLQVTAWVPAVPVLERSKDDFAGKFPGVSYEVVDRGSIETHDALTVAMASGQ
ncbi:MAG TPA: twin-arginine translocation signal domain-containing protein [Anaerolineae bacterium]|nr:twin-arginine translocation signal domain-containing protein [Anaerolineae bacterium]